MVVSHLALRYFSQDGDQAGAVGESSAVGKQRLHDTGCSQGGVVITSFAR
jgi:hypothetical protein